MKKALMVVDMQVMPFIWKDYGGKSIYEEDLLIDNVGRLIEKARKAGVPVYYILYTEGEGSPRSAGQPLWQVHHQIAPQDSDRTIIKYYADSFLKTDLDQLLQQDGVDTVVICGVQTEFCIDATVKSAYSHGYHVVLAKNGHSTFDSDLLTAETIIAHHNAILDQFAEIIPSDEIGL
jgi:nicotinamidase-related amidase